VDIYENVRKTDSNVDSYTYSLFIKEGVVFYCSMIPYSGFKSKNLDKERQAIIKMLAHAVFPKDDSLVKPVINKK
jgi:hypothetical protein